MKKHIFICLTLFGITGMTNAAVIDFEANSLVEDGFQISSISGTLSFLNNLNVPDSGSEALLINFGSPASFQLTSTTGNKFDLFDFQSSEGRNISTGFFPRFGSTGITVTGFFELGGNIVSSFNLDQIAEENSLLDFQLFTLSGFQNLSSVTFTAFGGSSGFSFGIDDITVSESVSSVPVPAAVWLFGSGLIGLIGMRK